MKSRTLVSVLATVLLGACSSESDGDVVRVERGVTGSGGTAGSTTTGIGEPSTGSAGSAGGPVARSKFDAGTYDKPVVVADPPPPPISGGTLTVISLGHKAAVADSDRDQVVVVDLDRIEVATVAHLQKGDEPGRLVEDGNGRLHVALRGGDTVATIDIATGALLGRQAVCAHPRGIAYDSTADVVHVACVGGELVTLPAAGGDAIRRLKFDRDLRDVVIDGERLLVSRFREAELLVVERDGHVSSRLKPNILEMPPTTPNSTFVPAVAWRTVAAPGGGALMAFQQEQVSEMVIAPGGYGGPCGGIVRSGVAWFQSDGTTWTANDLSATLPVDLATTADGSKVSIAGAGFLRDALNGPISQNGNVVDVVLPTKPVPPVSVPPLQDAGTDATAETPIVDGAIAADAPIGIPRPSPCGGMGVPNSTASTAGAQVIALAYDRLGRLLVQTREPELWIGGQSLALPGARIDDTGHELFHLGTAGSIACASCHPEGREDGHVWTFSGLGARRTQAIGGGILGTEPFHWGGDMKDFDTLAHQVFNTRMTGPTLQTGHVVALANWIQTIPAWRSTSDDPAAVERGRALFNGTNGGCVTCHAGDKMTNNATLDVGTGERMQVPSLLGVGFRAPFMHNGCAATLADRFGPCGGGDMHGRTSLLSSDQKSDLVTFLESL